jgi:hypothetical protein
MTTGAPDGYTLPKAAADLIALAEANGWLARAIWTSEEVDDPFVCVDVGRKLVDGEEPVDPADPYAPVRGDKWAYRVTWHSRDARPGQLKLFRRPLAATPWRPAHHDGPSVKGIREVIERHPDPRCPGCGQLASVGSHGQGNGYGGCV